MPAFNPFLPSWEYIPDGEPRLLGSRVYLFGSHDRFGGQAYCEGDYVGWSAPVEDLSAWRYEGVIYRRDQHPEADKGQLFAPDVVQGTDGRYYLYYSMSQDRITSVAVCDEPAGAYRFLGHVHHPDGTPYGRAPGDTRCFDPGVLVDDDGRVYLYTGFATKGTKMSLGDAGYAVELAPDMLTVRSEQVMTIPGIHRADGTSFESHAFFEASSIRKIDGRYNLIYSSVLSHELCYAWSDHPMGPYAFGGTVISIADIGLDGHTEPRNATGNTHGGLVQLGGQWYIFYHRQTNLLPYSRQACAEPVFIAPDGHIAQVETTSCGLNGDPLPGTGVYEARIACNLAAAQGTYDYGKAQAQPGYPYFTQSGGDREGDGDQYIANLEDGGWACCKYFAFSRESRVTLTLRGDGEGVMHLSHSPGGQVCAEVPVHPSGDWTAVSAPLSVLPGKQALYFTYRGTGHVDFKTFTMA